MTDDIKIIANNALETSGNGHFDASSQAPSPAAPGPALPPARRRWLRWLGALLAALIVLPLLALAALWVWAGTEGSLATALRLAGARVPLVTDEVTGNLRSSGKVQRLVWEQGGLRVEVHDAALEWTPAALLRGTLHIGRLSASRILIDDQRPPSGQPSAGPPATVALPLKLDVEHIRADELVWAGPPAYRMQAARGRFHFDGQRHLFTLEHAQVQGGAYHARAAITAHAPLVVDVALAGALTAAVPGGQPVPLTLQARLTGPLTDMRAQADVQAAPMPGADASAAAASAAAPASASPAASAAPAASTPSADPASAFSAALAASAPALPALPDLPALDLAAAARMPAAEAASPAASLPASAAQPASAAPAAHPARMADAPSGDASGLSSGAVPDADGQTALAGADGPRAHARARLTPWAAQPVPEAHVRLRALDVGALWAQAPATRLTGQLDITPLPPDASGASGWAVQADMRNLAAGPWDQRRLPVSSAVADVHWQSGVATVHALRAELGGGHINATGRWAAAPSPAASAASPAASALPAASAASAAQPAWQVDARISGINPAALHTQLAAFPLDGTAQVTGQAQGQPGIGFELALQARAQRAAPPARVGQTAAQALARDLHALRLRDASATGHWADGLLQLQALRVRTSDAELSGSAQLRLAAQAPTGNAPGGSADLRLTAPGLTLALKGQAQPATGAGTLRAQVADASRLLDWARKLPGAAEPLAPLRASGSATLQADWRGGWRDPAVQASLRVPQLHITPGAQAEAIDIRNAQASLQGRLNQASLSLQASAAQGPRALDLRLAASGGRTTPQQPLAQSAWRLSLSELQASASAPELGQGRWQLAQRSASVPLTWQPAQGGRLEVGAGELAITSPEPVAQAQLAWGPSQWQAGQLRTTGRLSGLPLEWAERLSGALAQAGLTGNVIFNGEWDVILGDTLRVQASLARASGDVTVLATDAQTGVQSRVPAGLRDARVQLDSDGRDLRLSLLWDSAQAGTVNGQLGTRLAATRSASGRTQWAWPPDAPLSGQLQARLPQVAAWSVLAPPGWRLRGALNADARLGGTRAQPLVTGTLGADDLALRSVVDGVQFENGRLRARLDGTRVLIDEFVLRGAGGADGGKAGEQGGGLIRATGEAGWIDGRAQARLNATLQQLRASIRADRQVSASGQVQAALDGRQISVDGRLRVDRARIVLPEESAPSLGDDVIVRGPGGKVMYGKTAPGAVARPTNAAGQQQAREQAAADASASAASAAPGEPLSARVNVQIDLGEDFRLQGMGIDTRLAGQLTLAANGPLATMPRLSGTVRTVSGTFRAYGQQLNITRGNIVFSGAIDNPALDIIALRPNYASDQRVGAQVMGTALLPRVRLYSEPALPDNEALAWLLLGRAAPSTGAEAAMLQSAALAVLGGRQGRSLASRFGLDELSFSSGEGGNVANASVTLGKRLSDRLYAAYEHSLAGTSGSLLVFYELSRRWTLRGQAGENAAVDLIYRLSFD